MKRIPDLYTKYYIDKQDERRAMFKKISEIFQIDNGLYPGSFIHITPSFYIPKMTYIDTDKRCTNFFKNEEIISFINENKEYEQDTEINYVNIDFTKINKLKSIKYDLLISLYSGFISQHCKTLLKKNGILLVNNSHGDAPLAYLDKSYELISVINRRGNRFTFSDNNLQNYFITKNNNPLNKEKILKSMKGPGYKKAAYAYLFRKK